MARSKTTRKRASSPRGSVGWGGAAKPRDRRWNYVIYGIVALGLGYGAYVWLESAGTEADLDTLAETGRAALQRVESIPSAGGGHLAPGQFYRYRDRFPTSGPHDLTPTPPGVYREAQPPTKLVHALEHGNIVIYYDAPGDATMDRLTRWAAVHDGPWSGLVVTPDPGLGQAIVLTAWARRLRLDPFDPAAAAAFIDAYRGRGPENPIR